MIGSFDAVGVRSAPFGGAAAAVRTPSLPVDKVATVVSSKRLIVGLDLGQAEDPSAICVSEVTGPYSAPVHNFRELHRAPLGTPYPTIVDTTAARIRELRSRGFGVTLVVDATGPGRPVVDMFDLALSCDLVALTITGGDTATVTKDRHGRYTARVPKNELIGATVLALEDGRIRIASDHPEAETFRQELRNVEIQISRAGRETFTHRSGTHDDLVLAGACAVWWAHYQPAPSVESVGYDALSSRSQYTRTRNERRRR